jgi:hypothetical protein
MTRPQPPRLRLADWPDRLAAILQARQNAPFAWGQHDCALFAADVAEALTGSDPAATLRGSYSTDAEAEAVCPAGLEAAAAALLQAWGAPDVPPRLAQRGDLALVVWGNQPTMGVVVGDRVLAPGLDHLRSVPLAAALRCWAV